MYCRECGNQMPDTMVMCDKCGTKKGEGVRYCQTCGYHTSEQTQFCFNCGAKQRNIITRKMQDAKIAELNKQAKTSRTFMRMEKLCSILFLGLAVAIFIYSVTRPAPEDYSISIMQGTGTMWHNDPNVLFYWKESQEHLVYILTLLGGAFCSFVGFLVEKSRYKKLLKAIKEAKNVL